MEYTPDHPLYSLPVVYKLVLKTKKGKHEIYVCKLEAYLVELMYQEFNTTSTVETVNYGNCYTFLIEQH